MSNGRILFLSSWALEALLVKSSVAILEAVLILLSSVIQSVALCLGYAKAIMEARLKYLALLRSSRVDVGRGRVDLVTTGAACRMTGAKASLFFKRA